MKKSLIIISALLLVFATALTACGNKNVIVDKNGRTYTPVTDKTGNKQQDKWGRLIIEQTDEDGSKVTQPYDFPDKITNKRLFQRKRLLSGSVTPENAQNPALRHVRSTLATGRTEPCRRPTTNISSTLFNSARWAIRFPTLKNMK